MEIQVLQDRSLEDPWKMQGRLNILYVMCTCWKNKPHLVKFGHCITVRLWTFQPTLVCVWACVMSDLYQCIQLSCCSISFVLVVAKAVLSVTVSHMIVLAWTIRLCQLEMSQILEFHAEDCSKCLSYYCSYWYCLSCDYITLAGTVPGQIVICRTVLGENVSARTVSGGTVLPDIGPVA